MTASELSKLLSGVSGESAEYEARLLISHFGCCTFSDILLKNPDIYSEKLNEAVTRRLKSEPLAYILGETEFYGKRFLVSPDCLIPRADTEIIVEYAVKNLKQNAFFADLCTGSGCIAISILAHRPDCSAIACDISPKALTLAEKNACLNNVKERIMLVERDILSEDALDYNFDAVISNPPYIRSDVLPSLPEDVKKEPSIALDGGKDGMTFYRRIVSLYSEALRDDGFFLFETGYDQKNDILNLANDNSFTCECLTDYGKNHRGAAMRKKAQDKL